MAKTVENLVLEAFPQDGRIWRLEWIGEVELNPLVPSEPLIRVVLTPLKPTAISDQLLNSIRGYDHVDAITVQVGTGLIPILQIGTFWKHGRLVRAPWKRLTSSVFTYRNLLVSSTTAVTDAVSENLEMLNSAVYPAVRWCNRSKFLALEKPGPKDREKAGRIIIPCSEIFRFYYANGSFLANSLLLGQLNEAGGNLYDATRSRIDEHGDAYLHARQGVTLEDTPVVARFAFSRYAGRQAQLISPLILKNVNLYNLGLIETRFPFEGRTTLEVSGKAFKTDGQGPWHFLVFTIQRCSAPFPFRSLDSNRLVKYDKRKGDADASDTSVRKQTIPVGVPENPLNQFEVRHQNEPSAHLAITVASLDDRRFLDLEQKFGRRFQRKERLESTVEPKYEVVEKAGVYSTGSGSAHPSDDAPLQLVSRNTDVRDIPESRAELPPESESEVRSRYVRAGIGMFRELLNELCNLIGATWVPLRVQSDTGFPLENAIASYFPSGLQGKGFHPWAFLDREKTIPRQVMIAEISIEDRKLYLFDGERRPRDKYDFCSMLLLWQTDFQVMNEQTIRWILWRSVERYGDWPDPERLALLGIGRRLFQHNQRSTAGYAERIAETMQAEILNQAPPLPHPQLE
ncbi:MAG: hypothetical protein K1Y36_28780 [Blastocatellia bacterium]|nr:hypothetical protein [Blastocatellia bacterium]